jgi:hypothetical protein
MRNYLIYSYKIAINIVKGKWKWYSSHWINDIQADLFKYQTLKCDNLGQP